MIVVIESPSGRVEANRTIATGLGTAIAVEVARPGGNVQIVGRVGEDPVGDAVLLDLAAAGVGHVAVLRSAGEATPLVAEPVATPATDEASAAAALDDAVDETSRPAAIRGLAIDAADLELALRYLPDYRVIVVAPGLDDAALATATAAAAWSGAQLVVIEDGTGSTAALPPDATVLVRPDAADTAFSSLVARYAVELDRGIEPGAAFAAASRAVGWQPVEA